MPPADKSHDQAQSVLRTLNAKDEKIVLGRWARQPNGNNAGSRLVIKNVRQKLPISRGNTPLKATGYLLNHRF